MMIGRNRRPPFALDSALRLFIEKGEASAKRGGEVLARRLFGLL